MPVTTTRSTYRFVQTINNEAYITKYYSTVHTLSDNQTKYGYICTPNLSYYPSKQLTFIDGFVHYQIKSRDS